MKNHLTLCVTAAALVFLFPPLQSFLPQPEEFHIGLREVCVFSIGFFLVALAILRTLIFFLKRLFPAGEERISAILCCLTITIFIQQYLFLWKYGPLGIKNIYWSTYPYGFIDTPVWILCIFIGWKYRRAIARVYPKMAIVLLTYSTFILGFTYLNNRERHFYGTERRREDTVNLRNTFSKNKNVIVIVLDAFQGNAFQELIDEHKELKIDFSNFTYFRNATSAYGYTNQSVSNILSGEIWNGISPWEDFPAESISKRSLSRDLKRKGFLVELFYETNVLIPLVDEVDVQPRPRTRPLLWMRTQMERMAYVYDFALFKIAPHYLKRFVMNDGDWLLSSRATRYVQQINDLKKLVQIRDEKDLHQLKRHRREEDIYFFASFDFSSTVIDQNVFKYYHVLGPHWPLVLNEKFEIFASPESPLAIPGGKKMYIDQAHAYLKLVTRTLFNKLKAANLWDNTMIVLVGDHGAGLDLLDVTPSGKFAPQGHKSQAIPLFLVKPFGSHGPLGISDAPVALGDIPKTVFSALGIPAQDYQGLDVLSIPEGFSRKRYFSTVHVQEKMGNRKLSLYGNYPIYEYEIDGSSWDDLAWKVSKIIR